MQKLVGWVIAALLGLLALEGAGLLWMRLASRPEQLSMPGYCSVSIAGAGCYFTNATDHAARGVCEHLTLTGSGQTIEAGTVCSGTVGARASRDVTVRLAGDPTKVCHDAQGGLDWSKCTLHTQAL